MICTNAVYGNEKINLYYSKIDEQGFSYIKHSEFDFYGSDDEKLEYLLKILFDEPLEDMDYKLNDVEVLNYFIIDKELILNLSKEIRNYHGSSCVIDIRNQIVETITSLESIDYVTIYVDGKLDDIDGLYVIKDKKS